MALDTVALMWRAPLEPPVTSRVGFDASSPKYATAAARSARRSSRST